MASHHTTPPKAQELLTPEQAAEKLNVSAEHVRCLIRKGKLAAINIGIGKKRPLYRIPEKAMNDLVADPAETAPIPHRFKQHPPVTDHFENLL